MGTLLEAYEKSKSRITPGVGTEPLKDVIAREARARNRSALSQFTSWFDSKMDSVKQEFGGAYDVASPANAAPDDHAPAQAYQMGKDLVVGALGFNADMLSSYAVAGIAKAIGKSNEEAAKLVKQQRETTGKVVGELSEQLDLPDDIARDRSAGVLNAVFQPIDEGMRTAAKHWSKEFYGSGELAEEMLYNTLTIGAFAVPGSIKSLQRRIGNRQLVSEHNTRVKRLSGEIVDAQRMGNHELAGSLYDELSTTMQEFVTGKEVIPGEALAKLQEWFEQNKESVLGEQFEKVQAAKEVATEQAFYELTPEEQATLWNERVAEKSGAKERAEIAEWDSEIKRRQAAMYGEAKYGKQASKEVDLNLEWSNRELEKSRQWTPAQIEEFNKQFDLEWETTKNAKLEAARKRSLEKQRDVVRETFDDPVTPEHLNFMKEWEAIREKRWQDELRVRERVSEQERIMEQARAVVQERARRAAEMGQLHTEHGVPVVRPADIQTSLLRYELKKLNPFAGEVQAQNNYLWDTLDSWNAYNEKRVRARSEIELTQEYEQRAKVAQAKPQLVTPDAAPIKKRTKKAPAEELKQEPVKPLPLQGDGPVKYTADVTEFGELVKQIHTDLGLDGNVIVFGDEAAKGNPAYAKLKEEARSARAAGSTHHPADGSPTHVYVGDLAYLKELGVTGERAQKLVLRAMSHEPGHLIDILGQAFLEKHADIIDTRYNQRGKVFSEMSKPEWFAEQVGMWIRSERKPFSKWQKVLEKAATMWKKAIEGVATLLTGKRQPMPDSVVVAILEQRLEEVRNPKKAVESEIAPVVEELQTDAALDRAHMFREWQKEAELPLEPVSEAVARKRLTNAGLTQEQVTNFTADYVKSVEQGFPDFLYEKKELSPEARVEWAKTVERCCITDGEGGWATDAKYIPTLIDAIQHGDVQAMRSLVEMTKGALLDKLPTSNVGNFVLDPSTGKPKVYRDKTLAMNAVSNLRRTNGTAAFPVQRDGKWYVQKEARKGDTFFLQIEPDKVSTLFGSLEQWERIEQIAKERKTNLTTVLRDVMGLSPADAKKAGPYIEKRLAEWRLLDDIDAGLQALPPGEGAVVSTLKKQKTRKVVEREIVKEATPTTKKKRKSAEPAPDESLGVFENWLRETLSAIKPHYAGKGLHSGAFNLKVLGHALTNPIYMFETLMGDWGKNFFYHPQMIAEAAALKRTKFYVNQLREWSTMNKMTDTAWTRVMQYAYTKRAGGVERLRHSGFEPLKWEDLSPVEQRSYEFAKTYTKQMFETINDTRRKLGKRELKPDLSGEDYFTFLGRISDTGLLTKVLGGKADLKFRNPFLSLGNEVFEALRKEFPKSPVLRRINKAKVSWFEKRYSPDTLNEAVVYEVNGRKILEHYTSAVMREAHMAPLFATQSAVMQTALNPTKFAWLKDIPITAGRMMLDKGSLVEGKQLRKEIRELPKWKELHASTTDGRFTMKNELLAMHSAMRDAYGAGELKHLSVEQLKDFKQHLETGYAMNKIDKKVLQKPYVLRDEHNRLGYMVNQWLIDSYEGRKVNLTDNYTLSLIEDVVANGARRLSQGMILGNATSVLNQMTSSINTAVLGHFYTLAGAMKMITPDAYKATVKRSPHLQLRFGGGSFDSIFSELGRIGDRGVLDRWNQVAGIGVQGVDAINAVFAWQVGESKGKAMGLSGKELVRFADEFTIRSQGSGRHADLAPIQRTKIGSALTALQTFAIANANFLLRDVVGYRAKGLSYAERGYRMSAMLLFTYLMNQKFRNHGLYPPMPDPLWQIKEALDNEEGVPTTVMRGVKEMAAYVPMLSSLRTDDPRNALGVYPKAVTTVLKGLGNMPDTYENAEDLLDFLKTLALSDAGKAVIEMQGVGGLSQLLKMGRAWEGGYEGVASYLRGVDANEKAMEEEGKPDLLETSEAIRERLLSE